VPEWQAKLPTACFKSAVNARSILEGGVAKDLLSMPYMGPGEVISKIYFREESIYRLSGEPGACMQESLDPTGKSAVSSSVDLWKEIGVAV
jgi:hypothetical protein